MKEKKNFNLNEIKKNSEKKGESFILGINRWIEANKSKSTY